MAKKDYKEERKKVARLICMVLTEKLIVRNAILRFPKDINDASIKTAYHALIHREADEDFRAKDIDYKEEQDDYLEFLAEIMQTGDPLPQNIIKSYEKYYKNVELPHTENMKGVLKSLCKFLNV